MEAHEGLLKLCINFITYINVDDLVKCFETLSEQDRLESANMPQIISSFMNSKLFTEPAAPQKNLVPINNENDELENLLEREEDFEDGLYMP